MAKITVEDGMIVRVPVQVVDTRDRGNVRCLAGRRSILLDGPFLEEAAEVVAQAPPAQRDQLATLTEAFIALQARLEALETAR